MHWLGLLDIGGITFLSIVTSPEAKNEPSMQTRNQSNLHLRQSQSSHVGTFSNMRLKSLDILVISIQNV